ncbi:MAG: FAD-binding oxidoreductase [Alphaproteobacteria bacterium]|nr:FAD-binding oxidoreductase [Alphaproteobacteria bacterium]
MGIETRGGTGAGSRLQARLRRELRGKVLFDAASRGRYATDASIYQIDPIGVVIPVDEADAAAAIAIAADEGVPILPRGAGTSQCGQTVGEAVVLDAARHLNQIIGFDKQAASVTVQPGVVLDHLNAFLKPHGLWFPVDVSTSAQATIGGMAGNNSCGSRSIRYGNMVHNVLGIDAVLADGTQAYFGEIGGNLAGLSGPSRLVDIAGRIRDIAAREAEEIEARYPKLLRRVGGYNLETVRPEGHNLAHLLVGSEGTLAFSRRLHLKLAPLPRHRALGVCHFPTFYQAMDLTRHIVGLGPTAVELVDRTMIELARLNPAFAGTVATFLKGEPEAILLVEFAGDDRDAEVARLKDLVALLGDLGLPGGVVEVTDPGLQRDIWEVRKAGLNIMMSMKGDGKPVSFIEDCAVPLEHLAEYTRRLTEVFEKHGTKGTWYAHASVGCLHVRPILNMKTEEGPKKMRAIAEEAAAFVREYKGAYSGEHGDGLVRSEWIAPFFGPRLTRAFEEIKDLFDPKGLMNPGKIVRPSRMDDRRLFRFGPRYQPAPFTPALAWPEPGGFAGAVEMCNNNGHCRKFDAGVMCPSFRATGDEQHLTRGRANTLRLALSGQLGRDALTSDALYETMDLCVGCKGCKRECPTGVDMARMKTEFLNHYRRRHGLRLFDRLVAYLPRYAPFASKLRGLLALRDRVPALAWLSERWIGFSARRSLPAWSPRPFRTALDGGPTTRPGAPRVVLLVDTFNRWFEPENAHAAIAVLRAAGYEVVIAGGESGPPLCCGRTFLAAGLVEEARTEARRMIEALRPHVAEGLPIVGLEPSCLFTLRDEVEALLPGEDARRLAGRTMLFEEFLVREQAAGRGRLALRAIPQNRALVHGHCHQKAFDAFKPTLTLLKQIPGLDVQAIESGCCGMAGAFGYEAKHYDVSMKMAELTMLPAIRSGGPDALLVADGTSCRHQIADGSGRKAVHIARVLAQALR